MESDDDDDDASHEPSEVDSQADLGHDTSGASSEENEGRGIEDALNTSEDDSDDNDGGAAAADHDVLPAVENSADDGRECTFNSWRYRCGGQASQDIMWRSQDIVNWLSGGGRRCEKWRIDFLYRKP